MSSKSVVFLDVIALRERFERASRNTLVTSAEVAAWSGLAPGTLNVYRSIGRGPKWVKVAGHRIRYRKSDVLKWMDVREGVAA
jgi:predicted DNA-binding transcriptional regulator AlpA